MIGVSKSTFSDSAPLRAGEDFNEGEAAESLVIDAPDQKKF
jgi:hypothetical protein